MHRVIRENNNNKKNDCSSLMLPRYYWDIKWLYNESCNTETSQEWFTASHSSNQRTLQRTTHIDTPSRQINKSFHGSSLISQIAIARFNPPGYWRVQYIGNKRSYSVSNQYVLGRVVPIPGANLYTHLTHMWVHYCPNCSLPGILGIFGCGSSKAASRLDGADAVYSHADAFRTRIQRL